MLDSMATMRTMPMSYRLSVATNVENLKLLLAMEYDVALHEAFDVDLSRFPIVDVLPAWIDPSGKLGLEFSTFFLRTPCVLQKLFTFWWYFLEILSRSI